MKPADSTTAEPQKPSADPLDAMTQKLVSNFMINVVGLGIPAPYIARHLMSSAVGLSLAHANIDETINQLRGLSAVLEKVRKGKSNG